MSAYRRHALLSSRRDRYRRAGSLLRRSTQMRGNSCIRFGISKAERCDVRRSVPSDHAEYGEVETACSIILANFFERKSCVQEELGKRHPFGFPTMSWTPSASTASSRASGPRDGEALFRATPRCYTPLLPRSR